MRRKVNVYGTFGELFRDSRLRATGSAGSTYEHAG